MDEIIEKNLNLALQSLQPLRERFSKVDNRVKGDLLYVFGEMQQKELMPWLETVINGDADPEVKEAAREAIEKLTQKE